MLSPELVDEEGDGVEDPPLEVCEGAADFAVPVFVLLAALVVDSKEEVAVVADADRVVAGPAVETSDQSDPLFPIEELTASVSLRWHNTGY